MAAGCGRGPIEAGFKSWLGERDTPWRDGVEVVAGGFIGFKTATSEELPDAVAVMDPFGVVRLAGDALDQCAAASSRPPVGTAAARATRSHAARRALHTGSDLLTDKQRQRLTALFADDAQHLEVEVSSLFSAFYQRLTKKIKNRRTAQPSASATSPTTSRDRFWRPPGSDPDYTLDHEEPSNW